MIERNGTTAEDRPARREFLCLGALWVSGLAALPTSTAAASVERTLSFYNLQTGESLSTPYWIEGEYLTEPLAAINRLLRDHRTDEVLPIELGLLDLLHGLRERVTAYRQQPLHIVSAYRSPTSNAKLRAHNPRVAANSLHQYGKAVDIRLPGCRLADLHRAALSMGAGGVGYYPASDFIHIDVGRVRRW